jgi:ABC-type sugar transport system permease subunit
MTSLLPVRRPVRRAPYKETLVAYLFMIPTVIGFSIFVAYPLISSVYYALCDWNGLAAPKFVGLRNFIFMFTKDPTFFPSLKATGYYVILTAPFSLLFGFLLAVLLNKPIPGIKVFRTIYYLPVVLPAVAGMVLFKFIFSPDLGLANQLLATFGLKSQLWISSETLVMPVLLIYTLWGVGGQMIIFLSGLQAVPAELYEAAVVDGASGFRKMIHITIPMVTPILFLELITGLIGAFQVFTPAMIMTNNGSAGGGPGLSTYFLNYSIYVNGFANRQYGYAISQVWVMFAIVMLFTVIVYRISNSLVYYEAGKE